MHEWKHFAGRIEKPFAESGFASRQSHFTAHKITATADQDWRLSRPFAKSPDTPLP